MNQSEQFEKFLKDNCKVALSDFDLWQAAQAASADTISALQTELSEAKAENAELRKHREGLLIDLAASLDREDAMQKDAERYRAIPALGWYVGPEYSTYNDVVVEGECRNEGFSKENLDAAIDAIREGSDMDDKTKLALTDKLLEQMMNKYDEAKSQLTAAQAHIALLREALEAMANYARLEDKGLRIADEALAIQSDDAALNLYLSEWLKKEMILHKFDAHDEEYLTRRAAQLRNQQ